MTPEVFSVRLPSAKREDISNEPEAIRFQRIRQPGLIWTGRTPLLSLKRPSISMDYFFLLIEEFVSCLK